MKKAKHDKNKEDFKKYDLRGGRNVRYFDRILSKQKNTFNNNLM